MVPDTHRKYFSKMQLAIFQMIETTGDGAYVLEQVTKVVRVISTMPRTYATQEEEDPVVYLHYFLGACDWWITELDIDGGVDQAFGMACLGDPFSAGLGYISITEIVTHRAEMDLYWVPKPLSEIQALIHARTLGQD